MKARWSWLAVFLGVYGLHAVSLLVYNGHMLFNVPTSVAKWSTALSGVTLILLVVAHVATRDEVIRRQAMKAGAASTVVIGAASYVAASSDIDFGLVPSNLWAIALLVFLISYGVLTWRSRS